MTTTYNQLITIHEVKTKDGNWTAVPVVRNIEEAHVLAGDFPAVVTAGPTKSEVNFGHPNHLVQSFGDVDWRCRQAPTEDDVRAITEFGRDNEEILVHCHAGMSRSTSTSIGILLARNVEAEIAVAKLAEIHPYRRAFIPNRLIIAMLAEMYDCPDLPSITAKYEWY